jgi:hypothetical protein
MCDLHSDRPSCWSETWRRARKPHRCRACDETIRRGDRYHYSSGVWDGRPDSFAHCARCWAIYLALQAELEPGEGIDLDLDCGETWQSAFGEEPPEAVARLAFLLPDEYGELLGAVRT